ncbi:MAG TPA: MBL fold metallo-hydrolase [Terriglobales bacterium]|nr:MBL fold metallo-hydrolase [Terriglobales bacterium]
MTRLLCLAMIAALGAAVLAAKSPDDLIPTSQGDLKITFLGHASLMMTWAGQIIHVDPVSAQADYSRLPKADLVLITHDHYDHLDPKALAAIHKPATVTVASRTCAGKVAGAVILGNGEATTALGLRIEAVPAYNIVHKRPGDGPFHPKGDGNGYVIAFGDKRVYIAGDTENTPEMKALKNVDVAFLPMNLPYTMTPEMVADAARAFRPKILYPYHFGETDTANLVKLLEREKGIDVRIRDMK